MVNLTFMGILYSMYFSKVFFIKLYFSLLGKEVLTQKQYNLPSISLNSLILSGIAKIQVTSHHDFTINRERIFRPSHIFYNYMQLNKSKKKKLMIFRTLNSYKQIYFLY